MKISYNWLKWYIPEIPKAEKIADIFTYHLCEVEGVEKKEDDVIFDLNILPNRTHDLLSHQGIARELASQFGIAFKDPTSLHRIPESEPTNLKIELKTDKCRRYMGRIVRNVKVGPSPDWVRKHLESIGQKSINNIVDATNIVMYDCGQPCHAFDLDKLASEKIIVRNAKTAEMIELLGSETIGNIKKNKAVLLNNTDMIIADEKNVLAIAGVKGGKIAEVDENTKNILIEVANFDPISVRKTSKKLGILTDSSKRFENDLSPELASYAMREISGLLVEYGGLEFEEIVDVYLNKQRVKKLSFSADKISKILGVTVSISEIENILKRYDFEYKNNGDKFEISVPPMRLDLVIEEDMVEEIGRILGYDKVKPKIPNIDFIPKESEIFSKINWARNKLLDEGYSEVMTYAFRDKGEVEVLASASDKKFLRTNLSDELKESLKLNQLNAPLLEMDEIKIFEIGTIFKKGKEEIHVAYANKKETKEVKLDEFMKSAELLKTPLKNFGAFALGDIGQGTHDALNFSSGPSYFKMWSVFPFIVRDIAVWVPGNVSSKEVEKIVKNSMGKLVIRGPILFDEFKKDGKISYAFRLVFQSYERTLKDEEVNEIMTKIGHKIRENSSWQIR
ncbi:MAG: phenylalanine--tRNA ligase subunit beta [Patescibacteria group bacterium]